MSETAPGVILWSGGGIPGRFLHGVGLSSPGLPAEAAGFEAGGAPAGEVAVHDGVEAGAVVGLEKVG